MPCPAPACRLPLSPALHFIPCLLLWQICLLSGAAGAADLFPYGTAAGDTAMGKSDDASELIAWTGQGPGGSNPTLKIASTRSSSIYVNNNGCLSFGQAISSYSASLFPYSSTPIIAPLWCDVDTRGVGGGTVWYRVEQDAADLAQISTLITSRVPTAAGFQATFAFIATWDHVGYYAQKVDKLNTFQAVVVTNGVTCYALFLYPENGVNWLLADATGTRYPCMGLDAGNNAAYYNHPLSCTAGLTALPTLSNTTPATPGLFIYRIDDSTIPEVPAAPTTGTVTADASLTRWVEGTGIWTGDATVWRSGFNAIFNSPARNLAMTDIVANNLQLNGSGFSLGGNLQFNGLQFASPTDEVVISSTSVMTPRAQNAITQGRLTFRDSATLVAIGTGTINGGTINLRHTSRVVSYSADAITSQTALIFDSSFSGIGGTLDLRGIGATVGTINSVSTGGLITNSGSAVAALNVAGAGSSDFRGQIVNGTAASALTKSGAGMLTLYGTNTYTGPTTISAGTLRLAAAPALPAASVVTLSAGATLDLGGYAHTFPASTGDGTLAMGAGTATYNLTADATMNTVLSGTGGFVKTGSAVLTLNAATSHTGPTTISAGTLRLGVNDALATCSAVFLNGNATLDLNGHDQTVTNLDSYNAGTSQFDSGTVVLGGARLKNVAAVTNNWAGSITGTGTFEKSGPEPMHWLWGSSSFSGALVITQGVLSADAVNVLSPNAGVAVASGATLWLGGASQTVGALSGAGAVAIGAGCTFTVGAGDASGEFSGSLSGTGALAKTGTGTQTLSGSSSFTGFTYVLGGTLGVTAGGALSTPEADIVVASTGSGNFVLAGGAVTARSLILGHDGGSANAVLNGGTLTTGEIARWSVTSGIVFNGATLRALADSSVLLNGFTSGSAEIQAGGLIIDTNGFTVSTVAELSGSGTLTKTGAGSLSLAGAFGHTGNTVVAAGTLSIGSARLADSGQVSVSAGAVLHLAFSGTDTVRALTLAGVQHLSGTWGGIGSGAQHETALITGPGLLVVVNEVISWMSDNGLSASTLAADDDGDGLPNALEYCLGTSPTQRSTATTGTTLQGSVLKFAYPRRKGFSLVTSVVEWSDDLSTWSSAGVGAPAVVADLGTTESVSVDIAVPESTRRRFVRLRVVVPASP
ncbi:nidogen-like domain-containing protein [Prosthecobacter vanneervenii]|uniref:Autotransporter-associated beta strand protein n=1 Tax=Prosthecobacter vanneervenii TaxID=48466 RepID=A0A7W8DIU3_9BACT|nr:nidogen-like domain-containing protein [Prosthecobacter vanneervenii]MBB5031428.1 autotransporter-associated beta strand protein [Prosthecobacter vanneervenii]